MELITSTKHPTQPASEPDAEWDRSVIEHLLHLDNVWAVLITSGTGKSLSYQQRKDIPTNCPEFLDLVAGCATCAGEHLQVGELRLSVMMFRGAMVVGRHTDSGESAFVLAAPEANLGQVLAHIRKSLLTESLSKESHS